MFILSSKMINGEQYQDKELIAFDLYGTCIERPKGIFGKFTISRDLKRILETYPIDMDQIKSGNLNIDGVDVKIPKRILNKVKNDLAGILVYDDFLETIEYLKSKGYKTAVVSNLAQVYEEPLEKMIPEGSFDYKSLSFDVGVTKPNPKIFEHLRDVSGTDFDKMVMVGDSVQSDILGAKNVGIQPIFIDRNSKKGIKSVEKKGIEFIQISTLTDLKEIL